jgi:HPt (histidine-containing phosphotransfer) domain-containing protein
VKDGLARVAGNRKLYLKILRQFVDQQGDAVRQIAAALAAGDAALAERLAHTLKGVAGNIGAGAVQAAAAPLERLLRDRAPAAEIAAATAPVASALDALLTQLRAALGAADAASPPPAAPPADPAKSRAAAAELARLLSDLDPGAEDFVEANEAVLRALLPGASWPEFVRLVRGYDFSGAQEKLESALRSWKG